MLKIKEPKLNLKKTKVKTPKAPDFQQAGKYAVVNLLGEANKYVSKHSIRESGGGPVHIDGSGGSHYANFY